MSISAFLPIDLQQQSSLIGSLPCEIYCNVFSHLKYNETHNISFSCRRAYQIYIHTIAQSDRVKELLSFYINKKSLQDLERILHYFPTTEIGRPITVQIDLHSETNIKKCFEKILKQVSISQITILPEKEVKNPPLQNLECGLLSGFVKTLNNIKIFFELDPRSLFFQKKARQFSEGLALLGKNLESVEVEGESDEQMVFIKTHLPSTLKKLHFKQERELTEVVVDKIRSLPELQEITVNQNNNYFTSRYPLPSFAKSICFPSSLQVFTLTGIGMRNLFPQICSSLQQQCPDLKTMDLSDIGRSVEVNFFPKNLKTFIARGTKDLHTLLKKLCETSPGLESITLEISDLDDAVVCDHLHSFKQLRSFCISNDRKNGGGLLKKNTIDLFLELEITSLTIECLSNNSLQLLRMHGQKLLEKLHILIIGKLECPEDEDFLRLLIKEYSQFTSQAIANSSYGFCFSVLQ